MTNYSRSTLADQRSLPRQRPALPGGGLVRVVSNNPMQSVGIFLLAAELFIAYSRFFDVIATGYRIPAIVYALLLPTVLLGGGLGAMTTPTGVTLLAFTVWIAVTVPFGVWKSNSLESLRHVIDCCVMFAATAGLITTYKQASRIVWALACASLTGALLSYAYGSMDSGRLTLVQGVFADPNEYAMTLLMGIPLWLLIAKNSSTKVVKLMALASVAVIFMTFIKAGSRGGMIALIVMMAVVFWGASLGKKVLVACVGVIGFTIIALTLPPYLRARYLTFFEAGGSDLDQQSSERLQGGDVGSAEGRFQLLKDSLRLTLHNPLFGVGAGNFAAARFGVAEAEGMRTSWNVSHNTYTQISAETGILGLFLFLLMLARSFGPLRSIMRATKMQRPPPPHLVNAAFYTQLSMIGICASAAFLSIAYTPIFYILAGLATALGRIFFEENKMQRENEQKRPPVPGPATGAVSPGRGGPPSRAGVPAGSRA